MKQKEKFVRNHCYKNTRNKDVAIIGNHNCKTKSIVIRTHYCKQQQQKQQQQHYE